MMTDKAFSAVPLSLLMLVGVSGWQFYSLTSQPSHTEGLQALPSLPMTLATQVGSNRRVLAH